MKTCTKCNETKPLQAFGEDSRRSDGRSSRCRACLHAYQVAYREANRARLRAKNAQWRADNPEYGAAYYAENKGLRTRYRRDNPEVNRRAQDKYDRANPHQRWKRHYQESALRYGLTPVVENFTKVDVIEQYGDACAYCEDGLFEELDHYVPIKAGGPHTLANVRPSCTACNRAKGDRVPDDLRRTA